jgi:hypothetical protein
METDVQTLAEQILESDEGLGHAIELFNALAGWYDAQVLRLDEGETPEFDPIASEGISDAVDILCLAIGLSGFAIEAWPVTDFLQLCQSVDGVMSGSPFRAALVAHGIILEPARDQAPTIDDMLVGHQRATATLRRFSLLLDARRGGSTTRPQSGSSMNLESSPQTISILNDGNLRDIEVEDPLSLESLKKNPEPLVQKIAAAYARLKAAGKEWPFLYEIAIEAEVGEKTLARKSKKLQGRGILVAATPPGEGFRVGNSEST